MVEVGFIYETGVKRRAFANPRLKGSWDQHGRQSAAWSEVAMQEVTGEDGCPTFIAKVRLDEAEVGQRFRWGVVLDGPQGASQWGIATEIGAAELTERTRSFLLQPTGAGQTERYRLTYNRWMGAQKRKVAGGTAPQMHFAVWAPNARSVSVVFGRVSNGFIADDGHGIDPSLPVLPLKRTAGGIWESGAVGRFDDFAGRAYMFRIENAQGETVYRTDLHSRWQIGRGNIRPGPAHFAGNSEELEGAVSCSVIIDCDVVRPEFAPVVGMPIVTVPVEEFWRNEFDPAKPLPTRLEDLVIYELHVGSLGFDHGGPGTLRDAIDFIDHFVALGVNAVELLPMSEFSSNLGWGYGNTHHLVIESSAGGRDKFKHFVRECHRHGIAVIQDVVYNHFDGEAERAEWHYDSTKPEENIYYWYEGRSKDYSFPAGGYVNNGSSGWLPRLWEEQVRHLFISSAVQYVEEFHIDGLRVDLTQALHRDNTLNEGGRGVANANLFGQKLLREWSRTLRMLRPGVFLIAEDHTGWDRVTAPPDQDGLGFDRTWFATFYHNLIGDADAGHGRARLLHEAGFGDGRPLDMGQFAAALYESKFGHVVYHESHDEAGNSGGSLRTSRVAVNNAPLFGLTRVVAEARARVAFGLALLSAGSPMFYMGEEIAAQKLATYNNIEEAKEDILGERVGAGAKMFRFYQEAIAFSRQHGAVRSTEIDILHALAPTRVIAFTRRAAGEELLVVASLNDSPFSDGYTIEAEESRLPSGGWRETFNSDSAAYGGNDLGNFGSAVLAQNGRITPRLPARGFVVFRRE